MSTKPAEGDTGGGRAADDGGRAELERLRAVERAAKAYVEHWTAFEQKADWADERNRRAFALSLALRGR